MRRRVFLQLVVPLLSLCVLYLLLTTDPGPGSGQTELLEVSVLFREADSWSAARQGMEQAAADLGAELRFLTLSEPNQAAEQEALLLREAEAGADAILLVPADREALAGAVETAGAQAAVVTLETDMREKGAVAFVGVDNGAVGEALGRAALNGAAEGETVLLVDSVPGPTGVSDRLEAAAAVLEAAGRRVRVCRPRGDQSLDQALSEALAAERPALVLAFEAAGLEQAARSAQSAAAPPLVYGMGATATIAAYLEQDGITAIAAQNEFAAGYLAVEAAARAVRRTSAGAVEPLAFTLVRRETMYDPDNQKLLFPVTR